MEDYFCSLRGFELFCWVFNGFIKSVRGIL